MPQESFEIVEHTADWAIRVTAPDMRSLFSIAATGMSSLLTGDLAAVPLDVRREVELQGHDVESLLVEWLGELAYWAEMELLVMREFLIHDLTDTAVRATARGGVVADMEKHIKAVTYHDLQIEQTDTGLQVTIVFDV